MDSVPVSEAVSCAATHVEFSQSSGVGWRLKAYACPPPGLHLHATAGKGRGQAGPHRFVCGTRRLVKQLQDKH
jgi:hypothetical protein